ncbi:hypothetical protein Tco_0860519 [Tanacetum coccineum]|uniref:Uncharacterized protein n=1 Tax=Tanacetum coccineum TaxID=301880 RepID=A0ABQ5BI63_9ASTR
MEENGSKWELLEQRYVLVWVIEEDVGDELELRLGDDVERLWNELAKLGTSMKVLEVKELCKLLGSEGGESLRCLDAKLTLEMGQKERNGVADRIAIDRLRELVNFSYASYDT